MSEHQQMQQSKKTDSTFQKQAALVSQMQVSHPASIIQRARINPKSLTAADVLQLQRTIGNRAVGRLLSEIRNPSKVQQATIQRQEIPEEEEPLQGKFIETIQRQEIPEEEEPLQGKFERKPEKATCPSCMQRQEIPEEEEPLQGKFETIQRLEPEDEEKLQMKSVAQRQEIHKEKELLQKKSENNTGMPDNLKAGVESLSGIDMSDVRVHYNSDKPAKVGALAYTQGTNIHVAPGQERHLPHEAWHVVQQAQSRVKPTMQLKGMVINDDTGLEWEADEMGRGALTLGQDIFFRPWVYNPKINMKKVKKRGGEDKVLVQRMLVPMIRDDWDMSKKETITSKAKPLCDSQGLGEVKEISQINTLKQKEQLWLFSHGSQDMFCGYSAQELADLLVTNGLPLGERRIVLKGCKTANFAKQVQKFLNEGYEGYKEVEVVGFEGEASSTTQAGEMKIRDKKSTEDGKVQGALAHLRAMHEGKTRSQADRERKVKFLQTSRVDAVFDAGTGSFVKKDERTARKLDREKKRKWPEETSFGRELEPDEKTPPPAKI